jgi:hypothetical protein
VSSPLLLFYYLILIFCIAFFRNITIDFKFLFSPFLFLLYVVPFFYYYSLFLFSIGLRWLLFPKPTVIIANLACPSRKARIFQFQSTSFTFRTTSPSGGA